MRREKTEKERGRYSLKGSSLWGILVFAILVLVDQLTKFAADVYFNAAGAPSRIELIQGGVLSLCISYNPGIAFGGFGGSEAPVKIAIIVFTALLMAGLTVLYFKTDKRRSFLRNALVFVVAGGVGNLVDRLYYKIWIPSELGVRDMVQIDFGNLFGLENFLDFGVCNFADFFIVGGAIALLLAFFFFDRDAFFPVGKYKALAKEEEERQAAKKEKKAE
ncbi:MAG: signal peptidase II [Clostridia bacterium]|nr:signal peptidase II [Clostridia bacterium]